MYYLVKFSKDWADEFDVHGFAVFEKEEWDKIAQEMEEKKNKPAGNVGFGTNEGWEDETVGDYIRNFKATEVSEKERNVLVKLFDLKRGGYGHFPCIGTILSGGEDDD